jgi:hypothetical protein
MYVSARERRPPYLVLLQWSARDRNERVHRERFRVLGQTVNRCIISSRAAQCSAACEHSVRTWTPAR